jgi:hypothetical protein
MDSPHASAISALEEPALRSAALGLLGTQQTAEHARAENLKANAAAFSELDESFLAQPDERHAARAVLNRQARVISKAHEAHVRLDAELSSFLSLMLEAHQSAHSRRLAEAANARHLLNQSKAHHAADVAQLESAMATTKASGLRKAGRLSMMWNATATRSHQEMETLIALFGASLAEAEAAHRADVRVRELELAQLVWAPSLDLT